MNDLNISGTLDLLMVAMMVWVGGLALYTAIRLQRDYVLFDSKILYSTDCNPRDCRDDAGFIAFMVPRLWIFGLVMILLGVLIVLSTVTHLIAIPDWLRYYAVPALALGDFAWYIFVLRQAAARFWNTSGGGKRKR